MPDYRFIRITAYIRRERGADFREKLAVLIQTLHAAGMEGFTPETVPVRTAGGQAYKEVLAAAFSANMPIVVDEARVPLGVCGGLTKNTVMSVDPGFIKITLNATSTDVRHIRQAADTLLSVFDVTLRRELNLSEHDLYAPEVLPESEK